MSCVYHNLSTYATAGYEDSQESLFWGAPPPRPLRCVGRCRGLQRPVFEVMSKISMSSQDHVRVCQIGWAGRPWARNPKTPHFYWLGLGRPSPPNPSLLSTGPGPARPPKSLTFIDGPGPARPTQIPHFYRLGQASLTPHFYWPDPSLLSARPGGVTPGLPQPGLPRMPPERPAPISPGLGPSLFGKPSYTFISIDKASPAQPLTSIG